MPNIEEILSHFHIGDEDIPSNGFSIMNAMKGANVYRINELPGMSNKGKVRICIDYDPDFPEAVIRIFEQNIR